MLRLSDGQVESLSDELLAARGAGIAGRSDGAGCPVARRCGVEADRDELAAGGGESRWSLCRAQERFALVREIVLDLELLRERHRSAREALLAIELASHRLL